MGTFIHEDLGSICILRWIAIHFHMHQNTPNLFLACLQHQVDYVVWTSTLNSIPFELQFNFQVKAASWAKGQSYSMPWGLPMEYYITCIIISSHVSQFQKHVNFSQKSMHVYHNGIHIDKPHLKVLHKHCWTMCMKLVVIWTHKWIAIHCANKCILMGIHI